MKYKIGDKVIINNDVSVVYSIIDTDYVALYRIGKAGKHIKWMKEEDLSPAENLVDSEKATEEFKERLESGYFDESDKQLLDAMDEYPEGLKDEDTPHWEDSSNGWMCSKCKQDSTHDTEYCPHCHVKMANGVKDKKDEFPLSQDEIDNLLKALQNDDLTKKVHDMLPNYKAGYEQGYQEAKTEFYENRYQEGLQDAWELALELYQYHDNRIIFDHRGFSYILEHYSAAEALEKIKAYEKEHNKIEVGDVIEHETCLGIVTMINKHDMVHILWEYGGAGIANVKDLCKTGKHYDIQAILDGLKDQEE